MDYLGFECDIGSLVFDERSYPDHEGRIVYEHLKYVCSKSNTALVVTVSVDRIPPVIIGGHKLYRIAKELGHRTVRAIITGDTANPQFQSFVSREHVKLLDKDTIRKEEEDTIVTQVPHVFFFAKRLNSHAKCEFERRIAGFFRSLESRLIRSLQERVTDLAFTFNDTCGEFVAVTPVGDESWFNDFRAECIAFNNDVATIVSYQGKKFVPKVC